MSGIYGLASVGTLAACPALFLVLIGATPWKSPDSPAPQRVVKADVAGDAAHIARMFVPTESVIITDAAEPGWPDLARDPFTDWGPVIPLPAAEPASRKPARKAAPQAQPQRAAANAAKHRAALQRSASARRSPWNALMYGSGGSALGRSRDRAFSALFGSNQYDSPASGSGMRNNPYSGRISRSAGRTYYRKWYQ